LVEKTGLRLTFGLGAGRTGALQQAYRMLQASVQTNAFVMAYSECFLALGVILLVGSAAIWLCAKAKAAAGAAGH
jgi:hypothetical protein